MPLEVEVLEPEVLDERSPVDVESPELVSTGRVVAPGVVKLVDDSS